jgi:hypothetical protein
MNTDLYQLPLQSIADKAKTNIFLDSYNNKLRQQIVFNVRAITQLSLKHIDYRFLI